MRSNYVSSHAAGLIWLVVLFALGLVGVSAATPDAADAAGWQAQVSGTDQSLSAVDFVDASHGWAVGAAGVILATTDGGATWQAQASHTDAQLSDVVFADRLNGWATSAFGPFVWTHDGGLTWHGRPVPQEARPLDAVDFVDAVHGWGVSGSSVIATSDGGDTWVAQDSPVSYEWLADVDFADLMHGCAVGGYALSVDGTYATWAVIITTEDGGGHWTMQAAPGNCQLAAVDFADAFHGWAVGDGGAIYATQDGGATWREQYSGTSSYLSDVRFADANRGWVASEPGKVLVTEDGGETWRTQGTGFTGHLSSVCCIDGATAWAVGESGTIVATDDGGGPTLPLAPALGRPSCPKAVKAGKRFTLSGALRPHFAPGSKTVTVQVYRLVRRKWLPLKALAAVNADVDGREAESRYQVRLRIAKAGKYAFRGVSPATDAWLAASTSLSRTLTVK